MTEPIRHGRPARLHDVARLAGVHVSTVSRVLNETHDASVRPETRERILDAAQSLRYRPNASARGLKLASTRAIGYLVPSLRNPANSPIVRAAFDRAWERGYVVLLAEDADESQARSAYERLVSEHRIDGILVQSARTDHAFYDTFDDGHVPVVFVDRAHRRPGRNVTMRDADAGALAARHLIDHGHRAIVHLAGPSNLDTIVRRRDGFVVAATASGVRPTVIASELDERAGYDALAVIDRISPQPTAIYVANLNQAVGLAAALAAAGRRIPADLSVLCHDDDPLVAYLSVPLTAIEMPFARLGSTAVDSLVGQIDGERACDIEIDVAPRIVDRGSTGPPSTR